MGSYLMSEGQFTNCPQIRRGTAPPCPKGFIVGAGLVPAQWGLNRFWAAARAAPTFFQIQKN